MAGDAAEPLQVTRGELTLRGERQGAVPAFVCCHGLTATRRYVVHGSSALPRKGAALITYDARGHGESDPAPAGEGYGYEQLTADLGAVIEQAVPGEEIYLVGHSMGAHTVTAYALAAPERIAGLVLIGPVYSGGPIPDEALAGWDRLAAALRDGGPEAFAAAVAEGHKGGDPELIERIALQRIELHRHPEAVVDALRGVPRSRPFTELAELSAVAVPTLVVASHDDLDPSHPHAVAAAYAETIPGARLVSEKQGEMPLAWQGGKLSREIASFAEDSGFLPG